MKEVEPDNKWTDEDKIKTYEELPVATLDATALVYQQQFEELIENQRVAITLLMRLYDLGMAQLSFINKDVADQLYDAHARGEHSNPTIYIPVKVEDESAQD